MALTDMKGALPCSAIDYYGQSLKLPIRSFTNLVLIIALSGCATRTAIECALDLETTSPLPDLRIELLDDVPRNNRSREQKVSDLFQAIGRCEVTYQKLPYRSANNLICTIVGESLDEILVTAHHDRLGAGKGIGDNWSGITTLASLAYYYAEHKPIHTLKFIAFAEEEDELRGSYYYIKKIRKGELAKPRAVINVETIVTDSLAIDKRGAESLKCMTQAVAHQLDTEVRTTHIKKMSGDWEPFRRAGIPTLNFHSLNKQSITLLHTYRDNRPLVDSAKL